MYIVSIRPCQKYSTNPAVPSNDHISNDVLNHQKHELHNRKIVVLSDKPYAESFHGQSGAGSLQISNTKPEWPKAKLGKKTDCSLSS